MVILSGRWRWPALTVVGSGWNFAVCKFVGFRHGNNAVNILKLIRFFQVDRRLCPYDADDGNLGTLGKMGIQPTAQYIPLSP